MTISSFSTDGPQCPACDFKFTPDDPSYYSDYYMSDECPECGAKFHVEVHHSVSWRCILIVPEEKTDETAMAGTHTVVEVPRLVPSAEAPDPGRVQTGADWERLARVSPLRGAVAREEAVDRLPSDDVSGKEEDR